MKKTFLLVLFLSQIIFAQSTQLFKDYGIKTYSSYNLYLDAQDFFAFNRTNYLDDGAHNTSYNSHFGVFGNYLIQSDFSEHVVNGNGRINYNFSSHADYAGENVNEYTQGSLYLYTQSKQYFNDKYGLFGFLTSNINLLYNFKDETNQNSEAVSLGVGYGRIVNVKFVAQAYIINDELDANLSETELFNLAEVLEKKDKGYYSLKYKDNAYVQFYNDISTITKKPQYLGKIIQIISSSIYKTSERAIGYEFKVGTTLSFFDKNRFGDFTNTNDIFASIEYAYPIDFNKQFIATVTYIKNMHDKPLNAPHFTSFLYFSVDHNYRWSSVITAGYECIYPKDEIPLENYSFSLQSSLVVINSLSAYVNATYSKENFYSSGNNYSAIGYPRSKFEGMSTHFGLRYYIF